MLLVNKLILSLVIVIQTSGETRSKRGVPSLPDYFSRRVQPRIDTGVGIVKDHVVPAIFETALTLGNAGVTAVTQFGRAAKPVMQESAAHMHHVVSEHIAPGLQAGVRTLGDHAAAGADRVSAAMLGHERHQRVSETVGAFGTIAKFITGVNETSEYDDYADYVDYAEYHDPVYMRHQDYYSYDDSSQLVYPESRDVFYDYPFVPSNPTNPYANQQYSTNTERIDHNYVANDYFYGAEARNVEDQIDRNGYADPQGQTVEEALYVIGKNVLGTNVTNRLLPVAAQLTRGLGLVGAGFNTIGGAIRGDNKKSQGRQGVLGPPGGGRITQNAPTCTTPSGGSGRCRDIQACPLLLADLNALRGSICFKSLFVPGVCCPDNPYEVLGGNQNPDQGNINVIDDSVNTINTYPPQPPTLPPPQYPTVPSVSDLPPPDLGPTFQPAHTVPHNTVPGSEARCGSVHVPQGRIVGGNETFEGEVPWMSAIYLHGGGRREFWCGGTLVTDRHVLTAAHCTKDKNKKSFLPSQFTVRVGEWDLSDQDNYSVEVQVESIVAHPNFRPNGFYNDVAVFTLKQAVPFSQYIQPICLPTGRYSQEKFTHSLPMALGWGTTYYDGEEVPVLRGVPLPVWTNEDCDSAYFQPITEVFLCAGYADGGRDACQGDSGGPLMLYDEEVSSWLLIGIVSFGNRCAEPGYPGVYTRLTHFLDWIVANIS